MAIYPDRIRDIGNPADAEKLLEKMRQTPSLLPNMSIYQVAERVPEHFDDNMSYYARKLGVSASTLCALTTDLSPLERGIAKCTSDPQVAKDFTRELTLLLEMLFKHK